MSVPSPFPVDQGLQKPVCVFCGSSPGKMKLYTIASESVGQALANANIPLVYGGGRRGIMGVVSQACLQSGGYVHGIIPRALTERASEHTPAPGMNAGPSSSSGTPSANANGASQEGTGETILTHESNGRFTEDIVGSMHERKTKMAKLSQGGFIVLPGGFGTFEEVMEMITWNQLGIHRLPILILNIGDFYTHLKLQLDKAVEAGFISATNLSLCHIVNLAGDNDTSLNSDESRAAKWGQAAVKALKDWQFAEDTGYGIDWDLKEKRAGGDESVLDAKPINTPLPASSSKFQTAETQTQPQTQIPRSKAGPPAALFTTLRYTSPALDEATLPIEKSSIPLLHYHIERLREAHAYFAKRDGQSVWGEWVGDDNVWNALKQALEDKEKAVRGDWRVRVVLHPGSRLEVQVVPAPKDAGPFQLLPTSSSSIPISTHAQENEREQPTTRPLVLDPVDTDLFAESPDELDLRLYKTTDRAIYDNAYARGGTLFGPEVHPEVLLHTALHVLETTTSNIAVLPALILPSGSRASAPRSSRDLSDDRKWLTPRLVNHQNSTWPDSPEGDDERDGKSENHRRGRGRGRAAFLNGVMRRYLLDAGIIEECDITVDDIRQIWKDGGRIIGFNGLR
ncbi:hypothetical protein IAU59_005981 [Kwoniella sp. CBS 9459]